VAFQAAKTDETLVASTRLSTLLKQVSPPKSKVRFAQKEVPGERYVRSSSVVVAAGASYRCFRAYARRKN
jgi:hypothetical protein